MALVIKDRIKETSTTTGTGTLTLAGASTGFKAFSEIGSGNTTYYAISDGTDWEVGLGTVGSGTLSRDTILASSNAGSAVSWNSDVKDVFCTYPADKAVYLDASGNFNISGGDITFGDNDKAIFGAGSDLQIYHDGSNSIISDQGTGSLNLLASSYFRVKNSADTLLAASFRADAGQELYHNSSLKLATTSTGIDVTGTVTADTLSLNEASDFGIGTISSDTNWGMYFRSDNVGGSDPAIADFNFASNANETRLRIASNGDISFYEDTGTTPKFFWDASAESLGIGTASPARVLHTSGDIVRFDNAGSSAILLLDTLNNEGFRLVTNYGGTGGFSIEDMGTATSGAGTERMRIDSSGNVGIGTSSPSQALSVVALGASTADPISWKSATGNTGYLYSDSSGIGLFNTALAGSGNEGFYIQSSNSSFQFLTAGSERMRITSDGKVGIGTSSPSAQVHINAVTENTDGLYVYKASDDANSAIVVKHDTSSDSRIIADFQNASGSVMKVLGGGNVGIGTSSPTSRLHVNNSTASTNSIAQFTNGTTGSSAGNGLYVGIDTSNEATVFNFYNSALKLGTNATERMRIDSSGRLLVGTTTFSNAVAGFLVQNDGKVYITRDGSDVLDLNRLNSDGNIAIFRKDGTGVGSISAYGGALAIGSPAGTSSVGIKIGNEQVIPTYQDGTDKDNVIDLGSSSVRWDDIYATNGTIQTSDRNEKQDIEELSEAEQRVAVAAKSLMRKFRWKDAVVEKGDDARIHFGIIAQDLQDAFAAEGLDAGRYAMFISSTWWETQTEVPAVEAVEAQDAVYDDEGNLVSEAVEAVEAKEAYTRTDTYDTAEEAPEGATERTRLGVRYPELLAFIIAAI